MKTGMDKSRRLAPGGGRNSRNSSTTGTSNLKYAASYLSSNMSGGTAAGGRSKLSGLGGTRIGGSRRALGTNSRLSRSGSRKGKGKVDVARIIVNNRDVTPKTLSVPKSADGVLGQAFSGS